MHVDTKTTHSRRQLTVILYLNPGWEPEHGGELRVYPMPYASADIAPKFDRIAVFCSHQMLHRVRPSFAPRVCLSLWCAMPKLQTYQTSVSD
jgi:SM-20-related protein